MKSQTHVGSLTQSTGVPAGQELLHDNDTVVQCGVSENEQEKDAVCMAAGGKGDLLYVGGLISIYKYKCISKHKHRHIHLCILHFYVCIV